MARTTSIPLPNVAVCAGELAGDSNRSPVAGRIVSATFAVLRELGYAKATTSEIAARAKVSKRDLYVLFGSKEAILAAMISERAREILKSLELPAAANHVELGKALARFGSNLLQAVCAPEVIELFGLAVAESTRSPAVSRALEDGARQPSRALLVSYLAYAQSAGIVNGATAETMASHFMALLWEDLLIRLLMGLAPTPSKAETRRRASSATAMFLAVYRKDAARQ